MQHRLECWMMNFGQRVKKQSLTCAACSDIELRQKWSKQPYLPVTTGSLKKPTFSFKCLFCTCLLPSAEAHPP
eukprot:scaffold134270_cov22-Tisochrysis_lutea.AAC.1